MYISGAFFPPPLLFLVTKHKGTEKRESPSPAPKPRKVELSESEEDKGGKMAATDSVQQRRQYIRQNQQSSSDSGSSSSSENECMSTYKVVGTKPYIEISRLENVTPFAKEQKQ